MKTLVAACVLALAGCAEPVPVPLPIDAQTLHVARVIGAFRCRPWEAACDEETGACRCVLPNLGVTGRYRRAGAVVVARGE